MATPYIGEIRMVGFNFAPAGWAKCDGSTMNIIQNDALFALIGTTYGGDGQTTFLLPDLRGRIPVHQGTLPGGGSTYVIGQAAGTEQVTLTTNEIPSHTHALQASSSSTNAVASPVGKVWSANSNTGAPQFAPGTAAPKVAMAATAVSNFPGGGQPHENMAPFTVINFVISLFGVFPSQN